MLAKQVQHLLHNPKLLAVLVLKSKYFSNSSALKAKLGHHPSLIQQSFTTSLDLANEGLFWRIGNDEKTSIWGSKWLLVPTTYYIQCPVSLLPSQAEVKDLINPDTGSWQRDLILHQIFSTTKVNTIFIIPFSSFGATYVLV